MDDICTCTKIDPEGPIEVHTDNKTKASSNILLSLDRFGRRSVCLRVDVAQVTVRAILNEVHEYGKWNGHDVQNEASHSHESKLFERSATNVLHGWRFFRGFVFWRGYIRTLLIIYLLDARMYVTFFND